MRKRFVSQNLDLLPDVPIEIEVVAVEGPQSTDGLIEGAGPESSLVLQDDEEVQYPLRGQAREIGVRIVCGELLDPTVVSLARALRETFELDETGEVLIPMGRGDRGIFFS
jgi:hypothetical protein